MTKGVINNNFEPIMDVSINVRGRWKKFSAVIDTGFNGFISIPHKIISKTGWKVIGYEAKFFTDKTLTLNFRTKKVLVQNT